MSDKITVDVKYERGHTIQMSFVPADVRCITCGESEVWVEDSNGDYYLGPEHFCKSCGSAFYASGGPGDNWQHRQVLAALRGEDSPPREATT
jgi:hypothetical protein